LLVNKDVVKLGLVVAAFVGGGSLLMMFELLPEDHADDFHALTAGNMTLQSAIIMIREPTATDDTTIYAINEVAAQAISIAQNDDAVKEILSQIQGQSVAIAGVQPTLLVDSTGRFIHSSAGQVIITANQEKIAGKTYNEEVPFSMIHGKQGEARQQIWMVQVDVDRRAVLGISKEPDRLARSTIQPNLVFAEMNLFIPHAVAVESGSTIKWVNSSDLPHNVVGTYFSNATSEHVRVDSGFFGKDKEFQYTFDHPGLFEYRCTIHFEEGMKGTLVVT